ncbi:MAG: phospholipase [Gammaproteobacteria bacterium]|nr:phospholipase [Gammaproteobacteria bacterium]
MDETARWIENSVAAFALIRRCATPQNVVDVAVHIAPDLSESIAFEERWNDVCVASTNADHVAISKAVSILRDASATVWSLAGDPNPFFEIRSSCSAQPRVYDVLYPLSARYEWVNELFLNEQVRHDGRLKNSLYAGSQTSEVVGINHQRNSRDSRGGYTLYVPENYSELREWPLIVTLHGGGGHGRGHVWTWLRDARSCGAIVLCPTSLGSTWGLSDPELDTENILCHVETVRRQLNIDSGRLMLQGVSDGGTFSLLAGLLEDSAFTHLVPCFPSFHPMMIEMTSRDRLQAVRIYLIHGSLDWMFPIESAREANLILTHAGADVVFREIEDLSHSYPDDENLNILEWYRK